LTELDGSEMGKSVPRSNKRLFADGFMVAVANPKGLVFYTALFPQFIHFGKATSAEYALVFSTLVAVGWLGFMLYAVFGTKVKRLFKHPKFRKNFNRASGAAFVGAGLAMAFSRK
jgi:threonine/homoserine/homoserine lactone efflux protein